MAFKTNRGIINLHTPKEFVNDDGSITRVYPASFSVEGCDYVGNAYPQLSNDGNKIIKITLKAKQESIDINELYEES
jgi:hypothetical protein